MLLPLTVRDELVVKAKGIQEVPALAPLTIIPAVAVAVKVLPHMLVEVVAVADMPIMVFEEEVAVVVKAVKVVIQLERTISLPYSSVVAVVVVVQGITTDTPQEPEEMVAESLCWQEVVSVFRTLVLSEQMVGTARIRLVTPMEVVVAVLVVLFSCKPPRQIGMMVQ